MIKLKLKPQYEGLRITRNDIRIGKITFDANTVKEEHYQNYKNMGFDIFDEVEVCDTCNNGKCICKKEILTEEKPKRKTPSRRKKKTDEE